MARGQNDKNAKGQVITSQKSKVAKIKAARQGKRAMEAVRKKPPCFGGLKD